MIDYTKEQLMDIIKHLEAAANELELANKAMDNNDYNKGNGYTKMQSQVYNYISDYKSRLGQKLINEMKEV